MQNSRLLNDEQTLLERVKLVSSIVYGLLVDTISISWLEYCVTKDTLFIVFIKAMSILWMPMGGFNTPNKDICIFVKFLRVKMVNFLA